MDLLKSNGGISCLKRAFSLGFVALCTHGVVGESHAQQWTGFADGDWGNLLNWNQFALPANWSSVAFVDSNHLDVNLGGPRFVSQLLLASESTYTTLDSGSLHVLSSVQTAGELAFGQHIIYAPVVMANPAQVLWQVAEDAPLLTLGEISGSSGLIKTGAGVLTLGGNKTYTGTTTVLEGTLRVGYGSSGLISGPIVNDAKLEFAHFNHEYTYSDAITGTGELIKNGTGTLNLTGSANIGKVDLQLGTLNVLSGAKIDANESQLGTDYPNSTSARVSGDGALWKTQGQLTVGVYAPVEFEVSDQGHLISNTATVGEYHAAGSTVRITGASSKWENTGALTVGEQGDAILEVLDGGVVTTGLATIGSQDISDSLIGVSGTHSVLDVESGLTIGDEGVGELRIEDGGFVSSNFARIAVSSGGTGVVNINGEDSKWDVGGSLQVGGGVLDSGGAGTLNILGGQVNVAGQLWVGGLGQMNLAGGELNAERFGGSDQNFDFIAGRLQVGTYDGTLNQQSGLLAPGNLSNPGNSLGLTEIAHSYHLIDGGVEIEWLGDGDGLGAVAGRDFDQINVGVTANLAGTLYLLTGDFIPQAYDTITILTAFQVNGVFDEVVGLNVLNELGESTELGLAVTYTDSQVNVTAALLGDANLDGQVSLLDLDILGRSYGQQGTWANGDFNGDGVVSLLDLDTLGRYYGQGRSAFLSDWASLNVPEPGALTFVGLISLYVGGRRRRHGGGSSSAGGRRR